MRKKTRALLIPWFIAVPAAAIVGAAAVNMLSEAHTTAERQKAETESVSEDGVPPLDIIPELVAIEPNNSDEHYSNAP